MGDWEEKHWVAEHLAGNSINLNLLRFYACVQLAGRLLYQLYKEMHGRVMGSIEAAEHVTLMQDAWSKTQVG